MLNPTNVSLSNKTYQLIALLVVFAFGCTPPASKTTGNISGAFEENLSVHRPQYVEPNYTASLDTEDTLPEVPYVAPTNDIKEELDSVVTVLIDKVKGVKYINGLTIQVYTGNDRGRANNIRRQVGLLDDTLNPNIIYDQPNYKVRVGQYFNRVEANKDFTLLQAEFPQALLVPDKILINRAE